MDRLQNLQQHLDRLAAAGDDLDALLEAGTRAAIALSFRGTDAMIGLDPIDPSFVATATEATLAALRRCADAGRAEAWGLMAEATAHDDPDQALAWWGAGAAAGDAAAARALVRGLWSRRDRAALADARPWLVRAVDEGESTGEEERYLGWFSYHGIGAPKDHAASVRWHEAGAAKGDADAMFELSVLHSTGQGCARDPVRSLEWCRRAADAGNARAMGNLGAYHATGQGVPLDLALARRWYERAADAGNGRAAANLGVMHATGQGGEVDVAAARRWFARAEARGYPWWEMCEASGLDPSEYGFGGDDEA